MNFGQPIRGAKEMTLTKDVLIEMIRDKVGYPVKEAKEILEMILFVQKSKVKSIKIYVIYSIKRVFYMRC
jgi:radical SAM superfamily enzyme